MEILESTTAVLLLVQGNYPSMHSLSDHGDGQVGVTHRHFVLTFWEGSISVNKEGLLLSGPRPEALSGPFDLHFFLLLGAVDRSLANLFHYSGYTKINTEDRWGRNELVFMRLDHFLESGIAVFGGTSGSAGDSFRFERFVCGYFCTLFGRVCNWIGGSSE